MCFCMSMAHGSGGFILLGGEMICYAWCVFAEHGVASIAWLWDRASWIPALLLILGMIDFTSRAMIMGQFVYD